MHSFEHEGNKMWLDGYVYQDMSDVIEWRKYNWDSIITVIGREGSGKSTFGAQLCSFADSNFNVDRIVFTPNQFFDAINSLPDESSILYDEAITGADSAMFKDKDSVKLVSMLTQIRRKKLFIVICFPYLIRLNRYYVQRSTGMFYVYARGPNKRGYLNYYNNRQLNIIYGIIKTHAFYSIYPDLVYTKMGYASYYGRFCPTFPLNYDEYEKKKIAALNTIDKKTGLTKSLQAAILKKYCGDLLTQQQIADKIKCTQELVSQARI